jgi:hypothetical protein
MAAMRRLSPSFDAGLRESHWALVPNTRIEEIGQWTQDGHLLAKDVGNPMREHHKCLAYQKHLNTVIDWIPIMVKNQLLVDGPSELVIPIRERRNLAEGLIKSLVGIGTEREKERSSNNSM